MASVNIPSTVDDFNYRYKMPAVRCKVEGSGNGIKTNHMNMKDVSGALKRNPEYTTKFLACELCVHGRYFDDEGKAIFQGVHTAEDIAKKLDLFINAYVLCPSCKLPEIDLFVENKLVMGKCNACGASTKVNNIHRVAAYIVKNPPEGCGTVGGKPTKEEKRAAKAAGVSKNVDKAETEGKPKKKMVKKVVKKKKVAGADVFDLQSATANLAMVRLGEKRKEEGATPNSFQQELRTVQLTQAFDNKERFYIALGALFGVGVVLGDEDEFKGEFNKVSIESFQGHMPYLAAVAGFDSPKEAIEGLQVFMFKNATEESYQRHYPLILKALYDENIADGDDITAYYAKASKKEDFVKANATLAPLLKWLSEAAASDSEYESESEDEPETGTKSLA